ncbi:MAG: catalase [Ignavibacteriota bacterium]
MTSFLFTNQDGVARYGRYRISPQAGVEHLDQATAKSRGANYLFDEVAQRVAAGPIRFDILVQIAGAGDVVDDATKHWPSNRPVMHFGTVTLNAVGAENDPEHQRVIFDPIPRVDGIEPSDDPLLELRAAIYLISGRRRRQARQSKPGVATTV